MPTPVLPDTTLRCKLVEPPIVLPVDPASARTPLALWIWNVPVGSSPTILFATELFRAGADPVMESEGSSLAMRTPSSRLPEMTFPPPDTGMPIELFVARSNSKTPLAPFGTAAVPDAFRPIQLPAITLNCGGNPAPVVVPPIQNP